MRKNKLLTIFFVLLLSLMPFSSVVIASEEENIDSFDVHPANRWSVENDDTDITSVLVEDGLLNVTEIGDGTADNYRIRRDLRDLDGTIQIRYKVHSNSTTRLFTDAFGIEVITDAGSDGINLWNGFIGSAGNTHTSMRYVDVDGVSQTVQLTGSEDLPADEWLILKMDYDLVKSTFRYRVTFDNGSKLIDHVWQFISSERPRLFGRSTVNLDLTFMGQSNKKIVTTIVDYVKAPFKEYEWKEVNGAGSNVNALGWNLIHAEDNVDDTTQHTLVIPKLDYFSAKIYSFVLDDTALAGGEYMRTTFRLFTVDKTDGSLTEAIEIFVRFEEQIAPSVDLGFVISVKMNNIQTFSNYQVGGITGETIGCIFDFTITEDRSKITGTIRYYNDFTAGPNRLSVFSVLLSDVSADYSDEFVLDIQYDVDFDGDTEWIMGYTDVDMLSRDIFSDIGAWVDDVVGDVQTAATGGLDIFTAIFRWVVSVLTAFLDGMTDLLLGSLDAIGGILGTVITELQGLAADIATAVWDGVGDALDFIVSAVEGIWTAFIAIFDDIIAGLILLAEEAADLFFAIIEFLVVLLLDIVEELWTVFVGIIFFVWDALSLPDILSVFNLLLVGFGQAVTGFGQFVTDINALIGKIFTLSIPAGMIIFLFLNIPRSPTIGDWMANVFNSLMFDITFGVSIVGFSAKVPAGAVWIAIVIGSGILSGSILGGFF